VSGSARAQAPSGTGERLATLETQVGTVAGEVREIRREMRSASIENTRQHRENQKTVQDGFVEITKEFREHVETLHARINRQFRGAVLWVLGLAGTALAGLLGAVLWLLTHPAPWHVP
jgi:hypothetical protein